MALCGLWEIQGGDHFASHLTPNPGLKAYSLYIHD